MTDFIEFYRQYDEQSRLDRHPTEFLSTTFLLESIIAPTAAILDVAGGTGKYALYFAKKGHTVTLRDAVKEHIDLAVESMSRSGIANVDSHVGDTRYLHGVAAESYDVVLFMGPVYHLGIQDVRMAIAESLRVLKHEGLLVIAYVNKYEGWSEAKHGGHFISRSSAEMFELVSPFPLAILHHIATDGPAFDGMASLLGGSHAEKRRCRDWLLENTGLLHDSASIDSCIHGLLVAQKTR
jgi:ubiquinone/menaquinone biosynthesis C-methylase UbiE